MVEGDIFREAHSNLCEVCMLSLVICMHSMFLTKRSIHTKVVVHTYIILKSNLCQKDFMSTCLTENFKIRQSIYADDNYREEHYYVES